MSPLRAAPTGYAVSLIAALTLVACSGDTAGGPVAPSRPSVSSSLAELPFHGNVEASQTAVYPAGTNTAIVHSTGAGTATHLGRFTLVSDLTLDLITLSGEEQVTLTAANGDAIIATVAAQGTPNPNGLTLSTVESATITGGTGRFAGARGSYVLERVIVHATGNSTGTFTGTIQLAK